MEALEESAREAPGLYNQFCVVKSGVNQTCRHVTADLEAVSKEIKAIVPSNVNIL